MALLSDILYKPIIGYGAPSQTDCGTANYITSGTCVRYHCDTADGSHPGNGHCASCHDTYYYYEAGTPTVSQTLDFYDCLTSSGYFYYTFQGYGDIIYNPPVIAAGAGVALLSASPPALAVLTPLGAAAPGSLGATSVAGGGGLFPGLSAGGIFPTAALAVGNINKYYSTYLSMIFLFHKNGKTIIIFTFFTEFSCSSGGIISGRWVDRSCDNIRLRL